MWLFVFLRVLSRVSALFFSPLVSPETLYRRGSENRYVQYYRGTLAYRRPSLYIYEEWRVRVSSCGWYARRRDYVPLLTLLFCANKKKSDSQYVQVIMVNAKKSSIISCVDCYGGVCFFCCCGIVDVFGSSSGQCNWIEGPSRTGLGLHTVPFLIALTSYRLIDVLSGKRGRGSTCFNTTKTEKFLG